MSGILDSVDQRTRLAGTNRLEVLTFRLGGRQRYGINVFKVREVMGCPHLTRMPQADARVRGVAEVRGRAFPVIDLAAAIGYPPCADLNGAFLLVTEFSQSYQGLLVGGVDRIVNLPWSEVRSPPSGISANSYLTGVARVEEELVELLDVEGVVARMLPVVAAATGDGEAAPLRGRVVIADDSTMVRHQLEQLAHAIGLEGVSFPTATAALAHLRERGPLAEGEVGVVISDIEMPEMDGYTFTGRIKGEPALKGYRVILHSSLSGDFNHSLADQVGADRLIPKGSPEQLEAALLDYFSTAREPTE